MDSSGPEIDPAIAALLQAASARRTGAPTPGRQPLTLMGALFRRSTFEGRSARVSFSSADGTAVSALLQTPAGVVHGTLVYLHGGGWAMGSSEEYRHFTATLAQRLGLAVLSVDYRLAPEHRFPAALHDALGALRFAAQEQGALPGNARLLACMGDSAGAALATSAARLHNRRGCAVPVALQILAYPVCDHRLDTPSHRDYGDGYLLTTDDMRRFWNQYCPDPRLRDRGDCTPLAASDLQGAPPAVLATGALDPLQDEGRAYAARLAAAGVPVEALHFEGLPHGFLAMAHRSPAADAALGKLLQRIDEHCARLAQASA